MASKMEAMKARAAEAGKAKQAAMDKAKQAKESAKATAAYKASMGPDAAKAEKRQAEVNKQAAQANKQAAMKAASQKSAMAEQAKPYTDALDRAIKAKQAAPAGGRLSAEGLSQLKAKQAAARPVGGMGGAPARPIGGMGNVGGGMGSRAGMTRPARPMGGMGMKKGGKAGKK